MTSNQLIHVNDKDFLDQDDPIRGQNYVCMSFLSPEDVIKDKESYYIEAFFKKFIERNNELFNGLETLFPDKSNELRSIREQYSIYFEEDNIDKEYKAFKNINEKEITDKYSNDNDFKTNIRGIKIRGSYESLKEAQIRAEVLKKKEENKHNIYVGQVGCWCPWSANPEDIPNPEYAETQLNTLMREYNKNKEANDTFYEFRKKDLLERKEIKNNKKKMQNEASSSQVFHKLEQIDSWSEQHIIS